MSRLAMRGLVLAALAAVSAGAAGCKGMGGPPSQFGVNVTIDASAVSSTDRAKVVNGLLRVTGAESQVQKFDIHSAFASGQLRFRYIPSVTSGMISVAFDALDASDVVVATGAATSSLTLTANAAVAVTVTLSSTGTGAGKKGDSATCTTAGDCASGFCVDGVCCNERCDDVCASCAQTGSKGVCTAYAAGTDPENECGPKVPTAPPSGDAGSTGDGGGASADGGDAAAADGSAPAADGSASGPSDGGGGGGSDALVIIAPDGGIMAMPTACGGTCSGARACAFPGTEKSCGQPFCNGNEEVASLVCDGNGGCTVGLSKCTDYACNPSTATCRTQCAQTTDCTSTDYCTSSGVCMPKKGNAIGCTLSTECQSGFCASGVCCETACDQPGFTCNDSGSVGQCKCPGLTCTMGCRVFYPDMDGDGYGDKFAVLATPPVAGSARTGCVESPPSGFVADNTDCDDGDANAHPGQTTYFPSASALKHTFDYDCDGTLEKQTAEYPGGYCKFCGAVGSCDSFTSTCGSAGAQSSFQCPQESAILRLASPPADEASASTATAATATVSPPSIICQICLLQCCGCYANDQNGFTQTMNCGQYGAITNCGTCGAAGGAPANGTTYDYQRCR